MEQTKTPTRDYPSFSRAAWSIWDTLYGRRSHRKFLPSDADEAPVTSLEETMDLAIRIRGAGEGSLVVVNDREIIERIKKRAHKGAMGKINLWLTRSPVTGFIALVIPKRDVKSNRPRLLPPAAAAAEDVVLWLTERGLGTCWLGGINQKEVREALGLDRDLFIPVIIPFGKPKPQVKARDIDHVMYRNLSRKRKELSSLAFLENMDRPYRTGDFEQVTFSASRTQDIAGLLRQLEEKRESVGDVPLDLATEACLEAARISPSASNAQKWYFITVSAEQALGELASACGVETSWRAAIVGAGDPGLGFLHQMMERPFWMIDLPITLSQMSLIAASMDLAVDLHLTDIDDEAVNATVGMRQPFRAVYVMGIR